MQHKNEHNKHFVERTDALAAVYRCSMRDLAGKLSISQGTLFGGRADESKVSLKTWSIIEQAERDTGLAPESPGPTAGPSPPVSPPGPPPPRYVTDSLLNLGEALHEALKKGQAITAEAMWKTMAEPLATASALQLEIEKEQIEAMRPKPKITKGVALAADLHPPAGP